MALAVICLSLFSTPVNTSVSPKAYAAAGINHQINFQGKLVNPDGTNVTDGSYSIVFSLYNVSSAGSSIWTETDSVTVSSGIFQVNLGASCPFNTANACNGSTPVDFNNDQLFLGIKVGADAEMTPRIQFTAVPQAFDSEKLNGLTSSQFARTDANNLLTGTQDIQNTSTSAFILQKASAGAVLFQADTSNSIVGVGAAPTVGGATLQVGGTISVSTLGTTNTSAYLCRNSSNILAACSTTGNGAAFAQGGNSFGATATLGTTDANPLTIGTWNGTALQQRINITNTTASGNNAMLTFNGQALFQPTANSDTAFQIQNAGATNNLFTAATTSTRVSINGAINNLGGMTVNSLTTPTISSVTNAGTAGSTTWTYEVSAYSALGTLYETLPSAAVSTTTGNATLDGTNYNTITWAAISGAKGYNIYRTAAGGTPSSTGLIGTVNSNSTLTFNDTGMAASGSPAANDQSGDVGIGTSSPSGSFRMTVVGASGSNGSGILIQSNDFTSGLRLQDTTASSTISPNLVFMDNQATPQSVVIRKVGGQILGILDNGGTTQFQFNVGTQTIQGVGGLTLQATSTGSITVDSASTGSVNVGTGATGKQITIGNATGATLVTVDCGTGNCNFGATATDHTTQLGSGTGVSVTNIRAGTGGINIGTGNVPNTIQMGNTANAIAQTINIGNNNTASSTDTVVIGSTQGSSSTTIQGGTGNINLNPSGGSNTGVLVKPGTNSTVAFQVQPAGSTNAVFNVDTSASTVTVRGGGAAVLGSELMTSTTNFSSGWSGTGWTFSATNAVHSAGSTTPAVYSGFTPLNGASYQVTFTFSGASGNGTDTITAQIGGNNGGAIYAASDTNETASITTSSTGSLQFIPSSNWNGTITSVSVKLITISNSALKVLNSSGSSALEVHTADAGASTYVGVGAGQNNVSGIGNTALGSAALVSSISGSNNTALGTFSLHNSTTGSNNTALGWEALFSNTTGSNNVAIGNSALFTNTTVSNQVAIGYGSLQYDTTGGNNTGVGYQTLQSNTTGSNNTAIGFNDLQANTTGGSNLAVGSDNLANNTTGSNNVAIGGVWTLLNNTTGSSNSALGSVTLLNNSTGSDNVGLGQNALNTNTTGSNNVGLGFNADELFNNLSQAGAIGANAKVGTSNTIVLGRAGGSDSVVVGSSYSTGSEFSAGAQTYTTGTIAQAGTAITGTGTAWAPGMTGGTIIYSDGTTATVTYVSATSLTSSVSKTVTAGASYTIVWGGLNLSSGAALTLQNAANSTAAFQIQNAAGNSEFTIDTSGNQAILGKSSAINGALQFLNATNTNTATLLSGATSGTYTLTLPTAGVAGSQCLQSTSGSTTSATALQWGSCGAGGSTTLAQAYAAGASQTDSTMTLDSTRLGIIVKDASTPITGSLLTVQNNGGTTKYLDITSSASTFTNTTINLNAATIATNQATVALLNTAATTVNAFGAATALNVGAFNVAVTFGNTGPSTLQGVNNQNITVKSQGTGALTLTSAAAATWSTAAGALTVQGFGGLNLNTPATGTASTNSNNVTIGSGNATGTTSNSGAVSIDSGTATGTTGTISIGTGNASAISVSKSGVTTTVNGALTAAQLLTGQLGATISGAITSINASSNFATNINTGNSTGAVSIGNNLAGAIALQSASTINLTIGASSTLGAATNATNSGTGYGYTISAGNESGTTSTGGSISIDAGTGTSNNGTISIGTTNAKTTNIGNSSGASSVNVTSGTGNITLTTNGATAGTVVKSGTNSATAFQVQNTSGSAMLNADTTNGTVTVTQGKFKVNGLINPGTPTVSGSTSGGTLATGTTYQYKLSATGPAGETTSIAGNTSYTSTTGTTSITISWSAVSNATGYKLYRSTNGGSTWQVNALGAVTSAVDNGTNFTWGTTATPTTSNHTGDLYMQTDNSLIFDSTFNATATYYNGTGGNVLQFANINSGGQIQLLADTGGVQVRSNANSASALAVQNSSGNTIFGVDTTGSQVLFGKANTVGGQLVVYGSTSGSVTINVPAAVNSGSNYTITLPAAAPTAANQCLQSSGTTPFSQLIWGTCGGGGGGGGSRTITLSPEYPGAVFHDPGTNDSGTMTSEFDTTNNHNYYNWLSTNTTTLNSYEVVVRTQIPSDYASGFTNLKLYEYADSTSTANDDVQVTVKLYHAGTTTTCVTSVSILSSLSGADTWAQGAPGMGSCTPAAGDVLTLDIASFSKSSNNVRLGEISYQYTSND